MSPCAGQPTLIRRHDVDGATGAQWRHPPDEYGKWNSVCRRYRRWVETGVFEAILETLAEMVERDRSADMIDSTVVRAHHCAVGIKGTQKAEALGRSRGDFTTKLHAFCDARGRPLGFVLTPGQTHDIQGFAPLFRMISDRIEAFLVDKGYDAVAIREEIASANIQAVIPSKSNRRDPIPHERTKYKWRNQIERLFNKLKNWRRIATRYDKIKEPYLGFVTVAAVKLFANTRLEQRAFRHIRRL